jgi:hypothetical protein
MGKQDGQFFVDDTVDGGVDFQPFLRISGAAGFLDG